MEKPEPNDRERERGTSGAHDGGWDITATHMAEELAAYRKELLARFEALVEKFRLGSLISDEPSPVECARSRAYAVAAELIHKATAAARKGTT